jgi:flagellar motor switch protein FliM
MATSGPVLTQEEVTALVDAMQSGDLDTSASDSVGPSVQPYSLVANDTTTRGQLAALEMINDRFSRQLRGGLLALLRQAVKITVLPFDVMTFNAYLKTLPSPCNVNIVRFAPLRGYGLVTLEPSVIYGAVDSFFGGRGGGAIELSPLRGFTPTEERIIQLLMDSVFENLRDAWAPVYAINPEFVSREINPAFAQVGEDRETVAVTRFDLELGPSVRGQLTVMYPFSALKPIRLLLRGRVQAGERDEKLAARWSEQLGDAVADSELELIAQLVTLRVSALDLAAIRPGDTLWFKSPPAVKVLVQSTHLFDAEYGTADGNAAVRIERVVAPQEDTKAPAESRVGGQEDIDEGAAVSAAARRKRPASQSIRTTGASAA